MNGYLTNVSVWDSVEHTHQMDTLAVISNCPQVNNPCNGFKPTPIRVEITG